MHFMSLNKFYDFMQVIYSTDKFYTKKQYFLKYKLFYTNSLLQ
jgi:hypothetical protein